MNASYGHSLKLAAEQEDGIRSSWFLRRWTDAVLPNAGTLRHSLGFKSESLLRMEPFKKVASSVQGNRRTAFTEAGGRKIGRAKDHPEKMWIDTYCAIKTKNLNAVFVCYVKAPGDAPKFHLFIDGGPLATKSINTRSYDVDQLTDALAEWRQLADLA